jgi:hypothetical protein
VSICTYAFEGTKSLLIVYVPTLRLVRLVQEFGKEGAENEEKK